MPVFPSEEWVQAWVALANSSAEFEASGKGREGAVTLVIESDEDGCPRPIYVRLDGRNGKLVGYDFGTQEARAKRAIFALAPAHAGRRSSGRSWIRPWSSSRARSGSTATCRLS